MRLALALVALSLPGVAGAQWDQAISDKDLLDPWIQAKAVVLALPAGIPSDSTMRERLARDFYNLEEELSSLRTDLENTAVSIVARPEFSYDAAQRSFELSQQMGRVEQQLDAVFAALAISDRPDVKVTRDSVANLRQLLAARTRFERDVLITLGSGSKNAIQALAARWWTAADRVNDVREAVAKHREQMDR